MNDPTFYYAYIWLVPLGTAPYSLVSLVIKSRCNHPYEIVSFPICWQVWRATEQGVGNRYSEYHVISQRHMEEDTHT